jgi:hypothetical protein
MGKMTQIRQIFKNNQTKPKSLDFYDKFHYVAKNIEAFCFFKKRLSYLVCSQIWLNYFLDYHQFWIHQEILLKDPAWDYAKFENFYCGRVQNFQTFCFLDGPINQDHHLQKVLNFGMHP